MDAFETTGTVDGQRRLVLDHPLPLSQSGRVRVIVLSEPNTDDQSQIGSLETTIGQLGDILDASAPAPRSELSDFAVSREGIYQDHP